MPKSTLERGRAAFAYKQVSSYLKGKSEKQQKNYRSYLKKLPAMIKTNGLGQTFAFYSSEKGAYRDIYEQIGQWLKKEHKDLFDEKTVVESIISMNSSDYRMITTEVIALTNWMRRFVDGLIN